MKISLDWITDFVDLAGIEADTIADRLTLSTAEVEGYEVLRRSVEGVLVAKVKSAKPLAATGESGHPLSLVEVDCGGRRFTTVCGAPNVKPGMAAPFAPAGVKLAGDREIRVGEVAGHRSEGVLCSPLELGLSRWHEGLLVCPDSLQPGEPLAAGIPATDIIIEIDNKSLTHRPDLWGHYAFARELAAIFGRPLKPLPMVELSRFASLRPYPLTVDDPDGCPAYGCIEFDVLAAAPSPLVIQRRLHALGQRTFNLMVDLTNYVMWELAQPMHAFDARRVQAIRVAKMGREGTFVTLDGQERRMVPDDLLIWNEKEPVALAGVMGGLNSEVEESTSRVLLESANFKGSRIRRTSVRLDLRSESAQRFEKNQPPVNVKLAIARLLRLVEEAGVAYQATSSFTLAGDLKDGYRRLTLMPGQLQKMAGVEIPSDQVVKILRSLGFEASYQADGHFEIGIPPHRSEKDISIPPDIAEEVLRVYGYGKIEPRMPATPLKPLYVNQRLRLEHKARRLLAQSHRFIEVHNYGWMDDRWLAQLGYDPQDALKLRNPSTQHTRRLRTTLVPNLLALVPQNRTHRDSFRLFELGHVYRAAEGGSSETTSLAGVSYLEGTAGLEEHFRSVKGAIEDLGRMLGREPLQFSPARAELPWQTDGHWVAIRQEQRAVGGLGVLAGPVQQAVVPEGGQVVWFEIRFDELEGTVHPELTYSAPPVYPGSWQDFSLLWDQVQGFVALEDRLNAFAHPLLMRREFLYAYKGKGLPPGKASYTWRFWIGAWDHTLASDEIEGFRAAMLDFLKSQEIAMR